MRIPYLLLVLILLPLLSACSDDSTSTGSGNNNDNNGNGEFAIVAIDRDTVYWNEVVVVTLSNSRSDRLTCFLHTVPCVITDMWRDGASTFLSFHVPLGASAGKLRIYENDTVLAAGDYFLGILQRDLHRINPIVDHFASHVVDPGDTMIITGTGFPSRVNDVRVSVNAMDLPVIGLDSTHVYTRIPEGMTSGPLIIRMLDRTFVEDSLFRTGDGIPKVELLPERRLSTISVVTTGLTGEQIEVSGGDTTVKKGVTFTNGYETLRLNRAENSSMTDLIIVTNEQEGTATRRLELRLILEPDRRASGTIKMSIDDSASGKSSLTELEIKNMKWIKAGDRYRLESRSSDVSKQLVTYVFASRNGQSGKTQRYAVPSSNAAIEIHLQP